MAYRIRALKKNDNRKDFECGQEDLDHFFKRYAGQNQFRHHIGVTYIATDESSVFGYITVAMGVLEADSLPEKKLPAVPYPLPVLRLGRLAVDRRYQGRGIGKQLLRHRLEIGAFTRRNGRMCRGGCGCQIRRCCVLRKVWVPHDRRHRRRRNLWKSSSNTSVFADQGNPDDSMICRQDGIQSIRPNPAFPIQLSA